ncbi:hypothetical protein MANES_11G038501v8 [Manihot esculenta]|uniref:Pentacotripeptide-repeat region of PRORP domain-containing protein n=1 Tax=Manihot esculenta TaxID=3983 RepID=A0A2C9UZP7_MANES|nr:hypothetical protein MANES_11G038501v8 [Manihot esculenta]
MRYCHSLTFSITNFSIFPFLVSRSFCSKARANRYASLLQLCCLQSPISCSFACAVHAHMIASGFKPRGHILNRLINIYSKSSKLAYARHLFDEIPQPGIVARSTLISAYSAIGDLELAKKIFNGTPLPMRDTVFYSAMITAYSHNNDGHAAIELFRDMRRNYFSPDNVTFTSVIGALALVAENERHCQQMHCAVLKSRMGFVTSVLNALIYAYVKCASSPSVLSSSLMGAARKLFDEILERDELSCSTIITGYMKNDDLDAARELFYGGGMCEEMVVAWNAMISGYMHRGLYKEALEMFRKMYLSGMRSDEYTYTSVISVCANASFFQLGKELHAYILKTEVNPSPDFSLPVNNALITLYWKCG